MKVPMTIIAVLVLAALVYVGLNQGENKPGEKPEIQVTEAALKKLAEADKLDGKEDKVIVRCYSCALGMDGKPVYKAKAGGYTLHFCTGMCCKHFEKDAEKMIGETEMPSEEPAEKSDVEMEMK